MDLAIAEKSTEIPAFTRAKTVKILRVQISADEKYIGRTGMVKGFSVHVTEDGNWNGVVFEIELESGARKSIPYEDLSVEDFWDSKLDP